VKYDLYGGTVWPCSFFYYCWFCLQSTSVVSGRQLLKFRLTISRLILISMRQYYRWYCGSHLLAEHNAVVNDWTNVSGRAVMRDIPFHISTGILSRTCQPLDFVGLSSRHFGSVCKLTEQMERINETTASKCSHQVVRRSINHRRKQSAVCKWVVRIVKWTTGTGATMDDKNALTDARRT